MANEIRTSAAAETYFGKPWGYLYFDWVEQIRNFAPKDGFAVMLGILDYQRTGEEPDYAAIKSPLVAFAVRMIVTDLKRQHDTYCKSTAARREKRAQRPAQSGEQTAPKPAQSGEQSAQTPSLAASPAEKKKGGAPFLRASAAPGRGDYRRKPEKPRYGNFDPEEAMRLAIARSFAELDDDPKNAEAEKADAAPENQGEKAAALSEQKKPEVEKTAALSEQKKPEVEKAVALSEQIAMKVEEISSVKECIEKNVEKTSSEKENIEKNVEDISSAREQIEKNAEEDPSWGEQAEPDGEETRDRQPKADGEAEEETKPEEPGAPELTAETFPKEAMPETPPEKAPDETPGETQDETPGEIQNETPGETPEGSPEESPEGSPEGEEERLAAIRAKIGEAILRAGKKASAVRSDLPDAGGFSRPAPPALPDAGDSYCPARPDLPDAGGSPCPAPPADAGGSSCPVPSDSSALSGRPLTEDPGSPFSVTLPDPPKISLTPTRRVGNMLHFGSAIPAATSG